MEQKEPKKPINDDILKCREDIFRASGSDSGANKPVPRKIPSFEEMIARQTADKSVSPPAAPIVVEDESEGSGVDILADTDWHLPEEIVELADDGENDAKLESILHEQNADEDLENILMSSDEIDPSSPVVSKAEQDELLAQFEDIDKDDSLDQDEADDDETEFVKDIEAGLAEMSHEDETAEDAIPEFNVYDRILSDERKESSTKRQGPGGGSAKSKLPAASGTVGDIINSSKGIAKSEISEDAPQEKIASADTVRGIIHGHDNMNDIQTGIISEIVARHIGKFYGKTG